MTYQTPVQESVSHHHVLIHLLLDDLREMVAHDGSEEEHSWLLTLLDKVIEQLAAEYERSCEGGYLAEVLEMFPGWSARVRELQQEHEQLCERLVRFRDRLDATPAHHARNAALREQLGGWVDAWRAHQARENVLLQDAFATDLGGFD